jgi:hypothetical protein
MPAVCRKVRKSLPTRWSPIPPGARVPRLRRPPLPPPAFSRLRLRRWLRILRRPCPVDRFRDPGQPLSRPPRRRSRPRGWCRLKPACGQRRRHRRWRCLPLSRRPRCTARLRALRPPAPARYNPGLQTSPRSQRPGAELPLRRRKRPLLRHPGTPPDLPAPPCGTPGCAVGSRPQRIRRHGHLRRIRRWQPTARRQTRGCAMDSRRQRARRSGPRYRPPVSRRRPGWATGRGPPSKLRCRQKPQLRLSPRRVSCRRPATFRRERRSHFPRPARRRDLPAAVFQRKHRHPGGMPQARRLP